MRFTDSLKILRAQSPEAPAFRILLACGSTPVHLQSFLGAHVQQRLPNRRVTVTPGAYGDCVGTMARADLGEFDACAVALEWSDLDARLGFRRLGGWGPSKLADIAANVRAQVQRLVDLLAKAPTHLRIAIALPTLRPSPAFFQTGWEAGSAELELARCLGDLTAWAVDRRNVHIVSSHAIDARSPLAGRFDLRTELVAGIAYSQTHAEVLGEALGRLVHPSPAKKGLITDLDNTLWKGIVGDAGVDGVFWDLDNHAQLHGLYQQLLRSLAEEGVLVAVASRNSAAVVEEAFARRDIVLAKELMFPFEVHWNRKSDSISRILEAWNIGADSVVFVDDSPMELEEVKAAHPGMECVQFPAEPEQGLELLYRLRDLFGRSRLSDEDALRRESLRSAKQFRESAAGNGDGPGDLANSEALLVQAQAAITFNIKDAGTNPRSLELVNKTNQFNLNGRRYTESDWHQMVIGANRFLISAAYEDKFGPLGTIAVIGGRVADDVAHVDVWVMSCRAFARRVEHQVVSLLFDRFGVDEVVFDFAATSRNQPTQQFFNEVLGEEPTGPVRLSRARFTEKAPALYHTVSAHE